MASKPKVFEIHLVTEIVHYLRLAFPAKKSGEAKFFACYYPHCGWTIYVTDNKVYDSKDFAFRKFEVLGVFEWKLGGRPVNLSFGFYNASHTKIELNKLKERNTPVIGLNREPEQNYFPNIVAYGNKRI